MQILTVLLLLSTLITLLFSFNSKQSLQRWVVYTNLGLLAVHLLAGGSRWQLYPVYLVIALVLVSWFIRFDRKALRYSLLVTGILATLLSIAATWAFPVFRFPEPTGGYSVGLQTMYLEDKDRPESITPAIDDYRKLTIQVWYPSEQAIERPEPYLDEGYGAAFAKSKGFPSFVVSHFSLIPTHTEKSLPIADEAFPVIVLSHGYGWNSEEYTSIIEELVSQGYIVLGVEHTHENPMTIFKKERLYPLQSYFEYVNFTIDFNKVDSLTQSFKTATTDSMKLLQMRALVNELPTYDESMNRWSTDISFLLDELLRYNAESNHFLYQRLDLDRIGLLGHSWGGAVVAQTAAWDNRVKAAINLDGAQWGELIDTVLRKPLLAIYADRNYDTFFTPNFFIYDQVTEKDYYEAIVTGTGHASFGDLPYWSNLRTLTETGTTAAQRMTYLNSQLIMRFFDRYMNGVDHFSFEEGLPEVKLRRLK